MTDKKIFRAEHIYKDYKADVNNVRKVLRDVCLDAYEGEFICILGYSGCGKTTLLRIMCGFEKATFGDIYLDDALKTEVDKNVLMLFQDFNQLLPWKTVEGNIVHPLLASHTVDKRDEAEKIATELLDEMGLIDYKKSYPVELSGGMKQRVAVARALALKPRVLLMDEPFASLDAITRRSLQKMTKEVCANHSETVFFVTHSVEEAVLLADRIIILNNNYDNPRSISNIVDMSRYDHGDEHMKTMLIKELIAMIGDN